MKTCLLCENSLKLIKFSCRDGHICKACYEVVSQNFSQTIKQKGLEELQQLYYSQTEPVTGPSFEITRKINQLVLFDDDHQLLCLPNHPKYCKETLTPEVYAFDSLDDCRIEEATTMVKEKKKQLRVGTLKVTLHFTQGQQISRDIWLIPNPIRVDSVAYKTMQTLAQKIKQELEAIQKGVISC